MSAESTFFRRSDPCGALRADDKGRTVALCGWVHRRRDHGGLIFIDLRDRAGLVQVVFNPATDAEAHGLAGDLRAEYVIGVRGTVVGRGADAVNPNLDTGEIEVQAASLTLLNRSEPLPISLEDLADAGEEQRLRWRFLDLRRPALQEKLALRHRITLDVRRYLDEQGFYELETPVLTKSTPEGARDYLVPSRVYPGRFFALPQSPQIFKQLFMVSGFERYFQIARCFRDEDLRADRQPEFTQIDLEMSFVEPSDIYRIIEGMMARAMALAGGRWPEEIPKLSYAEAMSRYGTDRPDLRYDLPIGDVTEKVADSPFKPFAEAAAAGECVRGIGVPGGAKLARREIDELTELVRRHGGKGLVWIKLGEDGVKSSALKLLGEDACIELAEALGAGRGDMALLAADRTTVAAAALGALRQELARRLDLIPADRTAPLWVEEFPLMEFDAKEGRWVSLHHPFTSPLPEDLPLLESDPGRVRSQAYDLVMNGWELGGGSIRIHDSEIQRRVFARLNLSNEEVEAKFGFFLRALSFGAPPHGGIALGLDRVVAMLTGSASLREVIAFPKTTSSMDLMTGSPSRVSAPQLEELGIALTPEALEEKEGGEES